MTERQFSAGGVVFRENPLQVIVIKPSGKDRWQLPKGWIDEGETSEQAAIREVKEEAGIEAQPVQKIDTIKIFFKDEKTGKNVLKMITFYLMKYEKGNVKDHHWETEEVVWLSREEALEKLTFKSEKEVLEKALRLLSGNAQQTLF